MNNMVSLAQRKFEKGRELTTKELIQLPLIDRCRYVVDQFFYNVETGFSTHDVTVKLIELKALNGSKAIDVHKELTAAYGLPA